MRHIAYNVVLLLDSAFVARVNGLKREGAEGKRGVTSKASAEFREAVSLAFEPTQTH